MSLIAAALLVAGGAFVGGWLARATRKVPELPGHDPNGEPEDGGDALGAPSKPDPFVAFPCRLGDVVLASDGEEAWLESAVVFSEEVPVLVLFLAPNAGADRAVLARPKPHEDLVWLTAAPHLAEASNWGPSEEPPSSLVHHGERYERLRRLPLSAERHGPSAPDLGDVVLLAEYKSATDRRLVAVFAGTRVLVWEGRMLGPGLYEVLPNHSP
ncbi:hypothetical protein LVJ94_14825 [Pendulispora rubella]|uniref:DUF4178 domain-containing protein n=1 Tax=Pendulispora rubella TaxID=2741070 RepID=A0ABZ2LCM2_9BACT